MKTQGSTSPSATSYDEALQAALRFLGYRARSEAEVKKHLHRRGYTSTVIETVANKLRTERLIDDQAFAQNWTLSRFGQGYGPKRIEQELKVKGVAQPLIREALRKSFKQGDEEEKARLLIGKRFNKDLLGDPTVLRRAIAFLQRRGFTREVVHRLLGNGFQED